MRVIKDGMILLSLVLLAIFTVIEGITYGGEIMGEVKDELSSLKMSYRIEGSYGHYQYVQVEILGTGKVRLSYEFYREYVGEGREEEKTVDLNLSRATIEEFVRLYERVDFFNLQLLDINKDKIRMTDVGKTTLTFSDAGKDRSLSYGYVKDNPLEELVKLYGKIAKEYLPNVEM